MRKITALFLAVFMAAAMPVVNLFAADAVIRSELGTYEYEFESGKEFDVTFVVENNPGICTSSMRVEYDPSIIIAVPSGDESTDGYLSYSNGSETERYIPAYLINDSISYPSPINSSITNAEAGNFVIATIAVTKNTDFLELQGDLKLFTVRFKMLKEGSTSVNIKGLGEGTHNVITKGESRTGNAADDWENIPVTIEPAKVILKSGSSSSSEQISSQTTTEAATQTTTSSSSSGGGNDNSSSSVSSQTTTKASSVQTATESTSEAQTEAASEAQTESANEASELPLFDDIEGYPWAVPAIRELAGKGIVNGIGNNLFAPSANVKRADFLIMLVRALELEADFDENFSDVTSDKYYYEAVGTAKALGIANGQGDNTFSPESYISRQDMTVLAKKAIEAKTTLESADVSVLDKFDDKDTISPYAAESLAAMANAGIINGTGSNIEPKANTTRAQAAVIIYNILNYVNAQ